MDLCCSIKLAFNLLFWRHRIVGDISCNYSHLNGVGDFRNFLYNKFFHFIDFKRQVDNQGFLSAYLDALIFFMGKQELKISEYLLRKQE